MKKLIYIILVLLSLLLFAVNTFAQSTIAQPIYYISPRVLGMGGAYTAVGYGPDAFFFNPAAYSLPGNSHLFFLDPTIQVNGDTVGILILLKNNGFKFDQNLLTNSEFINSMLSSKISLGLSGIPLVGFMAGGLAVAGYSVANVSAVTLPAGLIPEIRINGLGELGIIVGYSLGLGPLHVGVNGKVFARASAGYESGLLNFFTQISTGSVDSLPIDLNIGKGYSVDAGVLLDLGRLKIGATAFNIISTVKYKVPDSDVEYTERIPMQINAGISFKLGTIIPFILDDALLAADVRDVNGFIDDMQAGNNYALFTRVYIGMEARVLGLITARLGLHQGYPTFGITVNLLLAQINFAYYSRELSSIPGLLQEENFLIGISIIW